MLYLQHSACALITKHTLLLVLLALIAAKDFPRPRCGPADTGGEFIADFEGSGRAAYKWPGPKLNEWAINLSEGCGEMQLPGGINRTFRTASDIIQFGPDGRANDYTIYKDKGKDDDPKELTCRYTFNTYNTRRVAPSQTAL